MHVWKGHGVKEYTISIETHWNAYNVCTGHKWRRSRGKGEGVMGKQNQGMLDELYVYISIGIVKEM